MKIALCQIDTTVGDIRGNVERIRAAYRSAAGEGAELVLFPELAVTGYPPRDLLEQPDFIRANLAAVKSLAKTAGNCGLVVGYAEENPARTGKKLFNAAALLHDRKIKARRYKSLLPTYDVFDETRYFAEAPKNDPIAYKGRRLGVSICEDAWNDASFWARRLYSLDPIRRQVRQGAEILVNIAASPFARGKSLLRYQMLRSHARGLKRPLFYCAAVGGNDELIFEGNSTVLGPDGGVLRQGKSFEEDLVLADSDEKSSGRKWAELEDEEQVYRALIVGLRDYARKCGFTRALVGLSGGIDSAVVATLAADALGPSNVTAVSMPSMHSSKGSVSDSQVLAARLGIRLESLPITRIYDGMMRALAPLLGKGKPGLTEQNLQARIRGNLLMALSNKTGALLLSTGNKSELAVGYCTLYGDMSGGLAVIADLAKTGVYSLARWINRKGERIPRPILKKPPSAELAPNQKDQDDLPPYAVLDDILRAYVEEGEGAAAILRRGHPPAVVRDVLDRVDRNEYKRRQAPPVLRISKKAFGSGRRMPMARGARRG